MSGEEESTSTGETGTTGTSEQTESASQHAMAPAPPGMRRHFPGKFLPQDYSCDPLRLKWYGEVQIQTYLSYQYPEDIYRRKLTLADLPDILGEEALAKATGELEEEKKKGEKESKSKTRSKKKVESLTGTFDIFKDGHGVHGTLPKQPKKDYKDKSTRESRRFCLKDRWELECVKEYLYLNGRYTMEQATGLIAGNCMFDSILCQFGMQEGDPDLYAATDLRRQAVVIMGLLMRPSDNREARFPSMAYEIAGLYGSGDPAAPGPFTALEYLQSMLSPAFYGDSVVLHALAWHWDVKITIVNVKTLREQRFRHNEKLEDVDLVLVYNGHNHYIGAVRDEESYLTCEKVVKSKDYDRFAGGSSSQENTPSRHSGSPKTTTRRGRRADPDWQDDDDDDSDELQEMEDNLEADDDGVRALGAAEVAIPKAEWERLRGASETLEKIKRFIRKQSRLPGPDPSDIKDGDTKCPECKDDFKRTSGLRKHYKRFHVGETNYRCKYCDRIFGDMRGLTMHNKTHQEGGGKTNSCDKEGCDQTFTTAQAKKSHMLAHEQRGKGPGEDGKYPCTYECGRLFELPKGVTEHIRSCKENPNAKKVQCPRCDEKLSAKYFQKHQRRVHKFFD